MGELNPMFFLLLRMFVLAATTRRVFMLAVNRRGALFLAVNKVRAFMLGKHYVVC